MEKKLRLLVTKKCNRSCEGCCNKEWDLNSLPTLPMTEEFLSQFEIIMLTGGEPMLFKDELLAVVKDIKSKSKAKIYLYTAETNILYFFDLLEVIDGFQLTLHKCNVNEMADFNNSQYNLEEFSEKSFRLHVFPEMTMPIRIIPTVWKEIKFMDWVKDCPLPSGEVFYKLDKLL